MRCPICEEPMFVKTDKRVGKIFNRIYHCECGLSFSSDYVEECSNA